MLSSCPRTLYGNLKHAKERAKEQKLLSYLSDHI